MAGRVAANAGVEEPVDEDAGGVGVEALKHPPLHFQRGGIHGLIDGRQSAVHVQRLGSRLRRGHCGLQLRLHGAQFLGGLLRHFQNDFDHQQSSETQPHQELLLRLTVTLPTCCYLVNSSYAQDQIQSPVRGLAVGLRQPGARYLASGEVRWRFLGGRLYALGQGGTLLFPAGEGTLRPGTFASVGLGVDNAR